jgi:hypothetical protein
MAVRSRPLKVLHDQDQDQDQNLVCRGPQRGGFRPPKNTQVRWEHFHSTTVADAAFGGSVQTCHRRRSLEDVAIRAHRNEMQWDHWLALWSRRSQWIYQCTLG